MFEKNWFWLVWLEANKLWIQLTWWPTDKIKATESGMVELNDGYKHGKYERIWFKSWHINVQSWNFLPHKMAYHLSSQPGLQEWLQRFAYYSYGLIKKTNKQNKYKQNQPHNKKQSIHLMTHIDTVIIICSWNFMQSHMLSLLEKLSNVVASTVKGYTKPACVGREKRQSLYHKNTHKTAWNYYTNLHNLFALWQLSQHSVFSPMLNYQIQNKMVISDNNGKLLMWNSDICHVSFRDKSVVKIFLSSPSIPTTWLSYLPYFIIIIIIITTMMMMIIIIIIKIIIIIMSIFLEHLSMWNIWDQDWPFLNRGLTRACLKHCGTIPDDKDLFMILVTMGIISSKQS